MPLDSLTQTFPSRGKKKTTSKNKDQIILNPEYDDKREVMEVKESTAVMAFGRFNPPTVGHEKLLHKVHEVAKEHDGSAHVVASHSEGTAKDPLPQSKKLDYIKKVAPERVHVSGSSKESPSFLHAAKKLHDAGHKHLVMVAGSDRVDEYKKKLDQYNGKEGHFNFKSIKVVSSGSRDPDAEGVEGMSGTKMRAHARAGEHKEFKSGLPKALHPHAEEISNHIRSIKEDADYLEERVVTLQQRRRRALQMKRLQSKLKTARQVARLKMAGQKQLNRRAYSAAKQMLRRRFVGPVATEYQTVSPSDRVMMDRRVDDKIKLIKGLVKRILPRIRQAEASRLEAARLHKKTKFAMSKMPVMSSVTYDEFDQLSNLVESIDCNAKALNSLFNKSIKSEIPFNIIAEVYRRGIQSWDDDENTPQQIAFDRVNSFINGGEAFNLDEDLLDENLRKWFQDKWVRMDTKGNIKGQCAREPGEGKPKCLPLAKARAMDKDDRAAAARRKRREDPNPERSGSAINVRTEEKDACYHKVKARYKVWPSAYASGALSKCRKKGAASWGNKSEENNLEEGSNKDISDSEHQQKNIQRFRKDLGLDNKKGVSEGNLSWHKVAAVKAATGMDLSGKKLEQSSREFASKMGLDKIPGILARERERQEKFYKTKKEEFQIDEISKNTKMRYVAKAAASTNEPKDGEKQSEYLERLHKRMSGIKKALGSTNPSQRFQKEDNCSGAGDEGTLKLVKKYKSETPGQNEEVDIPDITTSKIKKITKQLDKSVKVHHQQSMALKKLVSKDTKDFKENFMDGKKPHDKGDMSRHGLKGKTITQLKKVRSSETASPRAKQLAHWFINMNKGKK